MKKGDMFTSIKSGEVFTVTSIRSDMVILATKGNFHSVITNLNNMDSTFVPYEEPEKTVKPK
jgi:hypothetical protein